MYCKKCKYHASDNSSVCPKCGTNWNEERKGLSLNWLKAGKWTSASSAPQAGAPVPPSISDVFQAEESAGLAMDDLEEFPDSFLQMPSDTTTPPASASDAADTDAEEALPAAAGGRQGADDDDIPEIDFSAFTDGAFQSVPEPVETSNADQGDLTIPGLEEMLERTATEDFSVAQSGSTAEDDIKLDFSDLPGAVEGEDSSGAGKKS